MCFVKVWIMNRLKKVKEIIRDASGNIVDWSDQEIQKQVHSVTKPNPCEQPLDYCSGEKFGIPLKFIFSPSENESPILKFPES